MTQTTKSRKEFVSPTTNSDQNVVLTGTDVQPNPRSEARICQIIHIDAGDIAEEAIPEGSASIDALVAKHEQLPERRKALQEARAWLKTTLGGDNDMRALRLQAGLSQAALAEKIGLTQAHISRIEKGRTDPQISTLRRIADAMGVDLIAAVRAFINTKSETSK